MAITSTTFVLFTAVILLVYYLLPPRWQIRWLLLASYLFCVSWAWQFALALLLLTAANYILAHRLTRSATRRRAWLWGGILLNVLTLIYFRSANFFLPQLLDLIPALGPEVAQILVPVGLSYYVLELIAYQVELSRGTVTAVTNPLHFALYLAYFPKLLAGPIERAGEFLPKLEQPRIVDNAMLGRSFTLIIIGAFRKLFIADTLTAMIPIDVFTTPANLGTLELWVWLFVYGFALYNDFAGYTSIVRGISGFFGIELSYNFHQPYFSRNFGEFWNNWHASLSHWLRDYIYFPTLRSLLRRYRRRTHILNVVVPPLLTMLVSALWHGFSLHMLVWGALHGVYQIGERILALRGGPIVPPDKRPLWRQLLAMGIVFVLVMWAWVPFRLEMPLTLEFWQQLLNLGDLAGFHHRRLVLAVGYLLLSAAIDFVQWHGRDELIFLRWPRVAQAFALATALFLLILVNAGSEVTPFVYQGF